MMHYLLSFILGAIAGTVASSLFIRSQLPHIRASEFGKGHHEGYAHASRELAMYFDFPKQDAATTEPAPYKFSDAPPEPEHNTNG